MEEEVLTSVVQHDDELVHTRAVAEEQRRRLASKQRKLTQRIKRARDEQAANDDAIKSRRYSALQVRKKRPERNARVAYDDDDDDDEDDDVVDDDDDDEDEGYENKFKRFVVT
jgi:hypothetical protein